jgi:two-component sensor histidine kinase
MSDPSAGPGNAAGANLLLADPGRLLLAIEAAGAGLWEWDLRKNVLQVNDRFTDLVGLAPGTFQVSATAFFERIDPDDIPLFRVALGEALYSDAPFVHEFRVEPEDEIQTRWLGFRGQVLERDEEGTPVALAGLCLDVTDRRQAQEAYDILNRELAHRMKNLFSVVISLVNMTSEHRPEARNFVTSFQARLSTFASTHEALMRGDWRATPLKSLVKKALSPLGVWDRIDLRSDPILLGPQDVQTVVLVLHELATNAMKHGALSNGLGRVALSLKAHPPSDDSGVSLVIKWTEVGGPPVSAPTTRGFGISLIERLTKRQVAGETVLDWSPEGLRCCIEIAITPARL